MRITGGKYAGRSVVCPPGIIRPAMDRMRESLFAILRDIDGRSFLDLFSGSGLVALEALSRGATPVVAVEKDLGKRHIIRQNTEFAADQIEIHFVPVERFIKRARRQWDYIFLDPPFAYQYKEQLLQWIAERGLLAADGTLLIHHPAPELLPDVVEVSSAAHEPSRLPPVTLHRVDRRTYGGSAVDFYRGDVG